MFCETLKHYMEKPFPLRVLKLRYNGLNDTHVDTLLDLVRDCPKLERLWLPCNEFEGGCLKIINLCARRKNLEIILMGNKGWSIQLLTRQRELLSSPWLDETMLCFWFINLFLLVLKENSSYALNEELVIPDLKEICGMPTMEEAKYVYNLFSPPVDLLSGMATNGPRPAVIAAIIELSKLYLELQDIFYSAPADFLKRMTHLLHNISGGVYGVSDLSRSIFKSVRRLRKKGEGAV